VPRAKAAAYDDDAEGFSLRAALSRALGGNPVDGIGIFAAGTAAIAILINALYMQPGPHPAPIFTIKPRPVAEPAVAPVRPRAGDPINAMLGETAARPRTAVITEIQRELARRGMFDGAPDGMLGPKTDAAIRDFLQLAGLKISGEPSEELLRTIAASPVRRPAGTGPAAPTRDPIAELIAPSARVTAVQRALSDYGYGPLKATGHYGPDTVKAIEKFERDRKLPVTGQISPRLMRELAAVTGRPLE
jgi:peptidoglycan hydrolase-like protein with peptidoglycan-binding domain